MMNTGRTKPNCRLTQLSTALILFSGLVLAACAGRSRNIISHTLAIPTTEKVRSVITDYQNRDSGAALPEWVNDYWHNNLAILERKSEFERRYVFVAEQSSANLNVLRQWARNFIPGQDFSQLVFLRVYDRLIRGADDNPDYIYGPFFEAFIKRTAVSFWPDAVQQDRCWIMVRESERNVYKFLILCVIDTDKLQKELVSIMNGIEINKKTFTRSQMQAVSRIKSNFWTTF